MQENSGGVWDGVDDQDSTVGRMRLAEQLKLARDRHLKVDDELVELAKSEAGASFSSVSEA